MLMAQLIFQVCVISNEMKSIYLVNQFRLCAILHRLHVPPFLPDRELFF